MHFKVPKGLSDDEYIKAVDIDDLVIWPLAKAALVMEEVEFALVDGVDNDAQREYIRAQVDELIYKLKSINDKLEDS